MRKVPFVLKSLFSSGLRVRILAHLFSNPGEDFHVRLMASRLGGPVGTTGRELIRLEKAGILASRPVGNQKRYCLAKDSPINEDLGRIFLKITGIGAELRDALGKIPGLELAFIYGSYAGGEARPASDIDLMVIGGVSDRQIAPVVGQVERRLKREVNYTLFTRSAAGKRIGKTGDFVHEVFSGPRLLLIGDPNDRLFQPA